MWKPGQTVTICEKIPVPAGFLIKKNLFRVKKYKTSCHEHHCVTCPLQQVYCNIENCEQNLSSNNYLEREKPLSPIWGNC